MLAPIDLVSAAERVFVAASPLAAARAEQLEIRQVRAGASGAWRLWHHEVAPVVVPAAPLFGEIPAMPARAAVATRVWKAARARLVGRRGLMAEDGALFLGGPLRNEADLARVAADCAAGGEGMMLRANAQLLAPIAVGERRMTGVGLHLGAAVGGRPFLLDQCAALLLIAELRPRIDYLVVADASPDLVPLLADLGLGGVKMFDLAKLQGVTCDELLVPVVAADPAGWVDGLTIERLRRFAAAAHAKLGPGMHANPVKIFLTDLDRADRPLNRLAQHLGYLPRGLEGRGVVDLALMMAKASHVATDQAAGALVSLFAGAQVPVVDFAGGNLAARLPLLAGAGRPYGFAAPEQAEQALAAVAGLAAP